MPTPNKTTNAPPEFSPQNLWEIQLAASRLLDLYLINFTPQHIEELLDYCQNIYDTDQGHRSRQTSSPPPPFPTTFS